MNGMTYLATEATGASGVTEAVTTLLNVATSVLSFVIEEPLLLVFFSAGIVFSGIGIIKAIK